MVLFFSNTLRALEYYFNMEPYATYLRNDVYKFITRLQSGLSKKLLKYNGHFSDFDTSSSSDSESESLSDSNVVLAPEVVKYEDKYLEDIKKKFILSF